MYSTTEHIPSCLGTLDPERLRLFLYILALPAVMLGFCYGNLLWKLFLCILYIKISNLKVMWCNQKWKYRDTFSGAVSSCQPAGFTGFMLVILYRWKPDWLLVTLPTLSAMFLLQQLLCPGRVPQTCGALLKIYLSITQVNTTCIIIHMTCLPPF